MRLIFKAMDKVKKALSLFAAPNINFNIVIKKRQ
jgi:hypothetical protein